jgi:hypothetical protein
MIHVELPDGSTAEFPDETPPETIKAAIQKRFPPESTQSYLEGLAEKGAQGATLGYADELAAGLGAGSNWLARQAGLDIPERSYDQILGEVRGREHQFEQKHPNQAAAAELAGAVAPIVATPGRALASLPAWTRTARGSAAIGAGFGGVSGFGHGEGDTGNRLESAAESALTGGITAPVISHVAIPAIGRTVGAARDAYRYGANALRSALNPEEAAVQNVADRMVASGLNPADARAAVSPPPSPNLTGRGFTRADMADIISRQMLGEPADQVAADYAHLVDAQGRSPTGATMRRYLNLYHSTNPTPLNIIDIAKEIQGEGAATPLARLGRAAHGLSGDASGEATQALMSRQATQSGRLTGIARNAVGGADYETTLQQGLQDLRNEAAQNYRQFYAQPDLGIDQLGDLMEDPMFRNANIMAQRQARIEAIRRNQRLPAGQAPEPVPTVNENNQVFSPENLDLIQRQLRLTGEGFANNPNEARHAQNLRDVFLDRIEQHYPDFRGIRQAYAQGQGEFGAEGALQAGRDMTRRLGERASEALRGFGQMTPAQQNLFRVGFARQIMDDAANPQIGGAVANKFNTPAVREIIERLWSGDPQTTAQGQALWRNIQREAITTRTKNDVLSGSRTAEYERDMNRLSEPIQAGADLATGRWGSLLRNLSTRLTTQLGQRGATETMRILTETDPAQLLPLLNRLEQAAQGAQARNQLVTQARQGRFFNRPAIAAVTGNEAERLRQAIIGQSPRP